MSDMTYLGFTYNNYGKKYNVVSTNLSGPEILADENLISNALIISSPTNGDFDGNLSDAKGLNSSHAMFFTDYKGNAIRLTYTIKPGNGLVVNAYGNIDGVTTISDANHPYSNDTLTFEIDKDSLKTISISGQLQVSKPDIIDNYTLMVNQELSSPHTYIGVVTANLDKATDVNFGIVRGDNSTISATNGILNVNTQNLDYVDDNANHPGIVRPNPDLPEGEYDWRTIEANNGVLRVLTYNLDRANENVVGVVKPEGITTLTDTNGTISVRTAGLEKASYVDGVMTYGIVRPDNYTIETNAPGVLYANAEHMTPTKIENGKSYFGVIKLDPVSFGIDTSYNTYVNRYPEIVSLLDRYLGDYTYIMNWLVDHENRITTLEHQNVEMIASFNNYGTTITTLEMPVWDPVAHVVHSEEKYYSVQFSISTNCKFHVSVEYQNNVAPGITLHRVKMGNDPYISGSGLSNYMFDSTNMNESTLSFEFLCNNYSSLSNEGNTPTTVFITVSSINDASVYKTGVHVFNRWNMEKFKQPIAPEPTITQEIVYSYYDEPDGLVNKDLYFVFHDGTEFIVPEPNNENRHTMTFTKDMSQELLAISSHSFYIVAEERMLHKRIAYTYEYVNGELQEKPYYEIDNEYSNPYTTYMPLALNSNQRTSYILNATLETSSRTSTINGDDLSNWEHDDNSNWVSYYMRNNALNTATGATKGHNIFDVMSTLPISVNDRRANIELDLQYANGNESNTDYSSWNNTHLSINYIEDITANDINVTVLSSIPQNTTRGADTLADIGLLTLQFNRTDNVSLNEPWYMNMQYCFDKSDGSINSEIHTAISNRGNCNANDDQDCIDLMNNNSISDLHRIKFKFDSDVTSAAVSISLHRNDNNYNQILGMSSNVGSNENSGITIMEFNANESAMQTAIIISELVPNTVISHFESSSDNIYSGFRIVNCTIEGENFETSRVNSVINWQSIGIWPTQTSQQNNMTFGDAYISNIHVYPWDDTEMRIEFNIMAGLMTNIPANAQVTFVAPYSNIWPNVVLFNGSNSYSYDDFYDNIVISMDGGWNPMGTKINIKLRNIAPPAPNPNQIIIAKDEQQQQQVWDRGVNQTNDEYDTRFATTETTVYANDNGKGMSTQNIVSNSKINNANTRGTDNQNLTQHQTTSSNAPLVQNITGIMFNFVLSANANGQTTTLYFAASGGLLTDKVYIAANYSNGASKDVNIINGLLNYTPSIVTNETTGTMNQETLDTLTYMYNKINSMNETLQDLVNTTTNTL